MTLGQAIKTKRKEKGLSAMRLSELLFMSERTIRKYECDGIDIPFSRIIDMCKVLGISVIDLLKGVDGCQKSKQ